MMFWMIAVEFAATGALAMFWFQGLSDGKSCWPRSVSSSRRSRQSTPGRAERRELRAFERSGRARRWEVFNMVESLEGVRSRRPPHGSFVQASTHCRTHSERTVRTMSSNPRSGKAQHNRVVYLRDSPKRWAGRDVTRLDVGRRDKQPDRVARAQ